MAPDQSPDKNPETNNNGVIIKEKMYTIQAGDRHFKLSGASLTSDSPSYFTCFFSNPANIGKHLFIDRSPKVFEKIYMHLQGYYISIEDEFDFVHLFADAHYFNLLGLKNILYKSDIFVGVGGKSFRISKELITSEGNHPNFFSVSFNAIFGDRKAVLAFGSFLRPPHMEPPNLSNHSPELFEELLSLLQGRNIPIRNEIHRENLMTECRYYMFLALEQQLVNHRIQTDPFTQEEEIILNLKDLKKKGISHSPPKDGGDLILKYSRPYADKGIYRNLIFQIENSDCSLFINRKTGAASLEFTNTTAWKLATIMKEFSFEMAFNLESNTLPVVSDLKDCYCNINGKDMIQEWIQNLVERDQPETLILFQVLKAQFKIYYRGSKPWFKLIILEAVSDSASFHKRTGFI